LETLHETDEDHRLPYCEKDYKESGANNFIKSPWRFKSIVISKVNDNEVVIQKDLFDFFKAVLDEVRIKRANAFAEYALYISDNEDLAYFRDTATKREIVADIDYNKQRDHAVHTLYNYILGWYIFEHSIELQRAFQNYFAASGIDISPGAVLAHKAFYGEYGRFCEIGKVEFDNSIVIFNEFADIWHIASLLHDVGYILEGTLSSASPEVENARIVNGSKIIHDYFNHYFWKVFEVDFRVAKNIAKTLGVVVPDFKNAESLSSLGDHLCDIGSCENLRKQLEASTDEKFNISSYKLMESYGLNLEAISIWKKYYQVYGSSKMQDILHVVEKIYRNNIWVGADLGKRNLDHGICSGLIVLQALTFFRELYWGFSTTKWNDFHKKQKKLENIDDETIQTSCNIVSETMFHHIQDRITHIPKRIKIIRGKFRSESWFKKVLWATASVAIHNIIQSEDYRSELKKHFKDDNDKNRHINNLKIGLDDPLAFLGVLVDILQEWDRYTVMKRGESIFSGSELLQSIDVKLGFIHSDSLRFSMLTESISSSAGIIIHTEIDAENVDSNKIIFQYPNKDKKWKKIITEKLEKCLSDWNRVVLIESHEEA
jgi:hypothetical protein